ncbi:Uncharacterized protein Rs2_34001 [Raphanus sativus]|nr:Uncharacterized protein Rs2_34001 [Raphanus sativus]
METKEYVIHQGQGICYPTIYITESRSSHERIPQSIYDNWEIRKKSKKKIKLNINSLVQSGAQSVVQSGDQSVVQSGNQSVVQQGDQLGVQSGVQSGNQSGVQTRSRREQERVMSWKVKIRERKKTEVMRRIWEVMIRR